MAESNEDEIIITEDEIKDAYQQVKEKVEYKQFKQRVELHLDTYKDSAFMSKDGILDMAIQEFEEGQNIQQTHTNQVEKISQLIEGNGNISIQGRLLAISNIKTFKTKAGKEGKVANLTVEDDTGKVRVVMWTDNMKYMNRIKEGDIIKVNNLEVQKGYTGDLEVVMRSNSSIQVLPEEAAPNAPKYEEKITKLGDIKEDGEYNIIARIIKIGTEREIPKDDRTLNLITLTLMDDTANMEFTLWNKDINLIDTLDLQENDTIKILKARAQYRYNQMGLTNSWNGRIVKGDYDLPEYKQEILKIGDAKPAEDVTILGIITRVYDPITFQRKDGTDGKVRSIEVADTTGKIRVTLWNKETEIAMDKGDIIKIEDANIEEDDYNDGVRLNTGWNASIKINPDIDTQTHDELKALINTTPTPIEDALDINQEEGRDIDVIGRILSIADIREFERFDGTTGQVRSLDIADDTGAIRTSLWDEKADINQSLGDAIKIENAKTRVGQAKMELSVGRSSRIITPSDEEVAKLPSYEQLAEERYHEKTLKELEDGETDVKVKVRIMDIGEINTFSRDDGTDGKVRSIYVADNTDQLQVSLWGNDTDLKFPEQAAIVIENPRIQLQGNDELRLTVASDTNLRQATQDEAQSIPTVHEIRNKLYPEKAIEDIDDDDRHIRIKANIQEIDGENILHPMCPYCHKGATRSENGFECNSCGQEIETPEYLMIIKTVLEDETGTISATFFRKEAEELISTTTDEVIEIFEKTGDESSLAAKIEDLIGHEVTIVADAQFNEYEEDVKLNVKKTEIVV
ncbi:OB-fold nucleic acid binding domain-containing protein [Methanosphaera cuniculi]|uniref:OB-fold nucleic acid binding domain-containing protein n=1 Tax=Methanosphaera cuniculi TaxID=1077256 RepID=UPI0026DACD22|nr:OB-fold nucleic acid binding domain-containing protein [Methanosphaera cuniculi]